MKKAIVTGATGFIGSAFVQYLTNHDVQVLALGRKDPQSISSRRRRKLAGSTYLKLPMERISALDASVRNMDWEAGSDCVFFNLAWGGQSGLSDMDVAAQMHNVAWCVSALEVAAELGCSRFIHVGTMEEAFTYKYLQLDHTKHSQYNRHVIYSIAKIAAKNALMIRASQLNMPFIHVLHSHVMGPDDDKNSFLQVTLQKLIRGEELIFSTGEQYFDVVSVDDCCSGYYLICNRGRPGSEYWVGSGDPRRLKEYVERMYALYPSQAQMQFGKLPYNDVILEKDAFSIAKLVSDTGYAPTMSYEQIVVDLHDHLLAASRA